MQYTVKPGDTLSLIARDVLGDLSRWPEIMDGNGLDSSDIFPGQVLILPDLVSPNPARAAADVVPVTSRGVVPPGASRKDLSGLLWVAAAIVAGVALSFTMRKRKRRRRRR